METDDICVRYANESVGIVLRLLKGEDGQTRTVLAEGGPNALRMLAELLIAVADGPTDDDSFYISPFGPGSIHFDAKSELGIYIHRV